MLALLGAAALVVWLARTDEDGRTPVRSPARDPRTGRPTPVVELAPPTSATPIVDDTRGREPPRPAEPDAPVASAQDELVWNELESFGPTSSIRGVRGLVRDAATRAPIPGAWLTWRYPDPTSCEQVLGAGARRGDSRTGMVTDAQGRFAVKRLADGDLIAPTLFAVASGYAVASTRPRLSEDVVIELEPMGTLEVLLRDVPQELEPGRPYVDVEPTDDPAREVTLAGRSWRDGTRVYRAPHLARGEYRVRLLGRDVGVVAVEPGHTARLELTLPRSVDVQGVITGFDGHAWLRLGHPDGRMYGPSPMPFETDDWVGHLTIKDGRVSGLVHEGRYVAVLIDPLGTERRLPDLVDVRDGHSLVLRAPEVGPSVEVRVRANGVVVRGGGVALVPLDGGEDRSGRDLLCLGEGEGHAGPGRYAVFVGALFAGEVVLPAGPTMIDTSPFSAAVRWGLPDALRDDEVLRGRRVVIPEVVARDPSLRRRYAEAAGELIRCSRASPTSSIPLYVPGRYLLMGETDLGPFEAWVDLTPGVEVFVPLGD